MLQRFSNTVLTVTMNTASSTAEELRFGSYSGGFFFLDSSSTITSITWYVAAKAGGTYYAAYDEDGVAITQTVSASKCYAIPSALFGAVVVKAVSDAEDEVDFCLKS